MLPENLQKCTMRPRVVILILLSVLCHAVKAQQVGGSTNIKEGADSVVLGDSFPKAIPIVLPPQLFIPVDRMGVLQPWVYAPIIRPTIVYLPVIGYDGGESFGQYFQEHPDKFFSNLLGRNVINLPQLYVTRQMMIGNTLRLGKRSNVYFLSGILYGSQMGVMGNNWGMGTREGILIRTKGTLSIVLWNQNFQSVSVYTPVVHPAANGNGAAVIMPATPEVTTFGVQASFVSGEFVIDIGVSYSPVPFQKRKHSESGYK